MMAGSARPASQGHPESLGWHSETTPLLGIDRVPEQTHSASHNLGRDLADDIDSRFRRWKRAVARRMRHGKYRLPDEPTVLISVFDGAEAQLMEGNINETASADKLYTDVEGVRSAIRDGVLPKMITTGSSGSYFARLKDSQGKIKICGVFKPADEEPYGNLNPKRAFLRKYFWWAMGRPCLIAGFSAMSEAGTSLLDDRLGLGLVPPTRLVSISSPSFCYAYKDRMAYETHRQELPEKMGSFQSFLHGYFMASTFLRSHPFPTRPRSVLERDLAAEQRAHRKSRKQYSARLRKALTRIKYFCLCRQGLEDIQYDAATDIYPEDLREQASGKDSGEEEQGEAGANDDTDFYWTPDLLQAFRLELEKLVVLDYLCRNTDRGLDNFMVKYVRQSDSTSRGQVPTIHLGAIDNSLAWPIKHPDGIREYPFGWLYLPADLIGGPFASSTREHLLPILSSPKWWRDTEHILRNLFEQDEHFNAKLFESQMAVFKGQGWNLVQSLRSEDEGPLELCARPKKIVHEHVGIFSEKELSKIPGTQVPLTSEEAAPVTVARQSKGKVVTAAKATPIPGGTQQGSSSQGADGPAAPVGAQPRSLPETSMLSQEGAAALSNTEIGGGGLAAAATPIRPGSLGIEVVEAMDRASRKRRLQRGQSQQRPPLAKAQSGSRTSQVNSERDDSVSGMQRWGRHNSRRYITRRPSAKRYDSVGTNVSDVLSEDEEDQYDAQAQADLAHSMLSEPDLSGNRDEDGAENKTTAAAIDRMASSDYFADYHPGQSSSGRMSSIETRIAASEQDQRLRGKAEGELTQAAKTSEANAVGSLRGNLGKSASYSPATTTTTTEPTQASASQTPAPPRRRRMRSVGQWSLSSFGSLNVNSREEEDEENVDHEGEQQQERHWHSSKKRVKALVQRLIDDKSLPWQAWLRA